MEGGVQTANILTAILKGVSKGADELIEPAVRKGTDEVIKPGVGTQAAARVGRPNGSPNEEEDEEEDAPLWMYLASWAVMGLVFAGWWINKRAKNRAV